MLKVYTHKKTQVKTLICFRFRDAETVWKIGPEVCISNRYHCFNFQNLQILGININFEDRNLGQIHHLNRIG